MEEPIEEEIWRDVEGYEGLYEVSNLGRVRSLDRYGNNGYGIMLYKGKILNPGKDGGGYLHVVLCKDNKQKLFKVHRLVWAAFNGRIPEGMQVNHIDEDKTNNNLDNLNLMTCKQNINWGTGIERRAKSKSKPIIQYSLSGKKLAEFESLIDAGRKLGICNQSICQVLKGKIRHTHGYIFQYKEQSQNKPLLSA